MDQANIDSAADSAANRRRFVRRFVLFKIPVYDADTRRFVGLVQDLSQGGVQLFGVKVPVGEEKKLIIQASQLLKHGGILRFDAVCRWSKREAPQGYYLSGFEITSVDEGTGEGLGKLIEEVTLG
ncbi:MAG: PilZ domain-containing protein [Thermodesulfobacteriota bacterium]